MEVTASFLADFANTDAANKVNALGIFGHIEADDFPALMPQFYLAITFNAERKELPATLDVHLSLVLATPERPETTVFRATQKIEGDEMQSSGHFVTANMIFGFNTLVLPSVGRYVFMYDINGQTNGQVVLYATLPVQGEVK